MPTKKKNGKRQIEISLNLSTVSLGLIDESPNLIPVTGTEVLFPIFIKTSGEFITNQFRTEFFFAGEMLYKCLN